MLDEEGCENRANRVQTAEERRGNAVEAHRRNRRLRHCPFLKAREEHEARADARQRARNPHRQDEILLFAHPAVFRGILVQPGRLQLVAQLRFAQQHPNQHGNDNRQRNGNGHIAVVGEQLFQPQRRHQRVRIAHAQLDGVRGVAVLHERQQAVDGIEADPVEQNAGDDLVDIAECFERAGDARQQRTRERRRQ